MTKTYIVPAFVLVDAESIEQADELACELAETLNMRRNLAPGTRLRLDEGKATIEAPEDFAGESLTEIEDAVNLELLEALERLILAAQRRDATAGDAINLIVAREALAGAAEHARRVIARATGGAA